MRTVLPILFLLVLSVPAAAAPKPHSPELAATMDAEEQRLEAERHLQRNPPDLNEARQWLETAAENGSVEAMGAAGWLYEQGLGVEPDPDRAMSYYRQAYEAGDNEYGLRLGWMYIQGHGVEPDRAQGDAWFRRVIAERDDSKARLALASVLIADASANVQPDPAPEARDLLARALDDGIAGAAYYLARIYMDGLGSIGRDRARAIHYARIGAEGGHPELQNWLAVLHARGEGVPLDLVEAYKWASLAAAGGDPSGERVRRELEPRMERESIEEARRRALEWLGR
ncbi:Sel1 domain protein repeat-containing protein [Thioalkalivibrio nitratireducens DSM 14787]|uniref:Sel1 domain protein repeat-containing protein n=1 Tax=Thioalkalivibrio nitratireducens (strain DSM 14787 / UNIQEM 213 / ALEN2) TaxID=1255043 RepID=L0DVE4_THIND|nr:tetratricopeptide repeat protein [Thioalkalivibrio nitratireducens]AGA32945.1 Sel1 domain protein repeat-containing protein [Thioalkalivibrio nitratireducens DSM 14787]